ncbi:MAG TPA: PKD domain-containing protein [Gaiellaceae bacterium]|nr:PKD domain-containing protein [Gaiellaceae bacterium]
MSNYIHRGLLAIALAIVAFAAAPTLASAAHQTMSPTFSGSGSNTDILSAIAVCDECAPDAFFTDPTGVLNTWGFGVSGQIQAQASWSNPSTIDASYTAGDIRHGQTVNVTDTLTPGTGSVTINYSLSGTVGLFGSPDSGSLSCAAAAVSNAGCNDWVPTTDTLSVGPITDSDSIPCQMPLPGESARDCSKTKTIPIWSTDLFDFASVSVNLILDETVHVTGTGVTTVRVAVVSGGLPIPNNPLNFTGSSPSAVSDPIAISCQQPVGSDLTYSLTGLGYQAEPATYTGDVKFQLSASAFGFGGSYTTPALVSTSGADLGPISMTAPDQQVDLGPVLANTIAPTASPGGPYSGVEGSPVSFDGSASSSVCGLGNASVVWHFSDGGVAFGIDPQHTFHGPGTYSGQLSITDGDGNVGTASFNVTIANLAPVANAGPDVGAEWGVPVALNGSALDPGTDEQPYLTYSWNFGDGSPSASGGASATHAYSNPGTYTATLTACDPEHACGTSTTHVVVAQRTTTTTYTGPNSSTPSKNITLTAQVVDDLGQPVAGRTVVFTLGTQTVSATTNGSGVASATIKLNQKHGSYTVAATFGGDVKYGGSNGSQTFTIGP